ncbi:hypothetical protein [Clostridium sp.]|uniref:hypothetical protein n=1 Tax=Clostridium sp. TaxID=1506 RepID=UPI001A61D2CF|nr:hypothetical protein [Clostridium sp.]MBK5234596.1 hypothetical protein [Clostridium sp.]
MRRWYKRFKCFNQVGVIIACIGLGIILVVVAPFWLWLIVAGGAIVYCGFTIMNLNHHC